LSTHSYEEGNITTLHIKLGSIYSEDFDLNVKLFMNSWICSGGSDKNCRPQGLLRISMNFYSFFYFSSKLSEWGYPSTHTKLIAFDLSSYDFYALDHKLLIENIKINHSFKREELIEKDSNRRNAWDVYNKQYNRGQPYYEERLGPVFYPSA